MRRFLNVFILTIFFGTSFSQEKPQHFEWLNLESHPFQFFFTKSDKLYAEELSSLFQNAYFDLKNRIELDIQKSVSVFLTPNQEVFNKLTGNAVPHWVEGVADPLRSLIILKSPMMTDRHERLPKLVRHELTHILIGQSVPNPTVLPKWFNEGMAIHLSADEEFTAGEAISKALLSNSTISLSEIDEVLQFQQAKAALAYEESYSFILYLIEEYGFGAVIKLIQQLNSSSSFEQAFQKSFGVDLFEAELDWFVHIEKKHRWSFLVNFEIYLWILILVIFILAFLGIRIRNKRTMQRWEREEGSASLDL